ncbi:hypothetical protein [Armatimonas sp.]|uniref:hypothetical protein n=1 Tax=Armatimonas sp. TaxID=1872638 RepID=UPI003751A6E4
MILSKSDKQNPETAPIFTIGESVHYITGGGRSFRLATVTHNKGVRIGIRLQDGTETRVNPWSLRRAS